MELTRGKVCIVDDSDYDYLSQWKWSAAWSYNKFYAVRNIGGHLVYMHRELLGLPQRNARNIHVDHINRDSLDNRRHNIRIATPQQNQRNRGKSKANKSGFKGVSWSESNRGWMSMIRINGTRLYLGTFSEPKEAHSAYCAAARKYHGEFARTS